MKVLLRVHALLISLLLDDSDSDSDSGDSDSASSDGSDTSSDASYSAESSSDSGGGGDTVAQSAQPKKRLNPEDLNPGDFGDIPPNFPNPPGQ